MSSNIVLGLVSHTTDSSGQYYEIKSGSALLKQFLSTASPESVVTAPVGSRCLDQSTGLEWRKATGTGNTGWVVTATNTEIGLLPAGLLAGAGATLPTTAARIGQLFWLDGVGLHYALDLVGNWAVLGSGSGLNSRDPADLSYSPSPTGGTVFSSTGTDAAIPLASAANAGLLPPGVIAGSGPTLPLTADRIGQLFWLDGVGVYKSLDLVGNWGAL